MLLLGAGLGAAYLLWPRPPPPLAVVTPSPRPTASPVPFMAVHVVGAVANPGVYRVPAGSRAEDAISLAGGLAEEADAASVNQAARLVDGQQLLVRAQTPAPAERGSSVGTTLGGKLNLNMASAADLDGLPGVGPVLAQRIVERRQRSGPYQAVEQLRDEKILPASTYERVKDLVSIN